VHLVGPVPIEPPVKPHPRQPAAPTPSAGEDIASGDESFRIVANPAA
jgi:hypothetical protein